MKRTVYATTIWYCIVIGGLLTGCGDGPSEQCREAPWAIVVAKDEQRITSDSGEVDVKFVAFRLRREVWMECKGGWQDITREEMGLAEERRDRLAYAREYYLWGDANAVRPAFASGIRRLARVEVPSYAASVKHASAEGRDVFLEGVCAGAGENAGRGEVGKMCLRVWVIPVLEAEPRLQVKCFLSKVSLAEGWYKSTCATDGVRAADVERDISVMGDQQNKVQIRIEEGSQEGILAPATEPVVSTRCKTEAGVFGGCWTGDPSEMYVSFFALGIGPVMGKDNFICQGSGRQGKIAVELQTADYVHARAYGVARTWPANRLLKKAP